MSAHTPGNWEVISDPSHFDTRTTVVSKDGGSLKGHPYRMTVQVGGWAGPREAEANARLIAAAPDLLEACQTALTFVAVWAGVYQHDHGLPDFHPRHKEAIEQVKYAIAKATGGAE